MATSINSVISNYTYTYNNQMRAKLDKDDNAVWDKSELTNYAKAYNAATGKNLDVDKLMEKYANEDGVIDYASQEKMRKDDALGFSVLKAATTTASTSTGSASSSGSSTSTAAAAVDPNKTMSQEQKFAVLDAVRAFSYEYNGKLQPLLDKDKDGMWSKDELTNYASAYKKATGGTLDVNSLIEKYGNEDGYIDPTNQAKMKSSDALGLTNLKTAYDKALATKSTTSYNDAKLSGTASKSDDSFSLQDLLGSMSSNGKAYFSMMINKYDSQSSMLNAFGMNSSSSSFDMSGLLSGANALQMYRSASTYGNSSAAQAAMSGQMMNFTF